ncbi:hypothetical protein QBC33DRAFT_548875 [Phialemonium atrogriseum]|uniref:Uncharacterized protein n=1 Tax=Phialemonium atrogriseum TaxID=1093897 RepID=A0AAJ0FDV4_9PEZI|nr:uncharacterized protein QBC33DRAFT_548875 [Phialemonium atrogriseum]KAK1763647.1 hypothetical protein QBC33DRAFT_548875 [Phialemonium atrogriseum]
MGVLQRAQQLPTIFNASALQVDAELIHAYQAAAPGSQAFHTRLIELVVVAVHQLAVCLFKSTDSNLHRDDDLGTWRPSEDLRNFYPKGPLRTLFRHTWYHDYDQYPEGVADGVGYWVETRIFGGVVLFDRRQPGSAPDVAPDAVYIHPDLRNVTYRICRLLEDQKQQLVQFLVSDATPPPTCPLPFRGDRNNRQRVDPEEPIETSGIYRDKWERRPPSADDGDMRRKDVVDTFNYISEEDWTAARLRGFEQKRKFLREPE